MVTIGMFDGVHVGHQSLIKHLVKESQQSSLENVVVTFWPHPKQVLGTKNEEVKLLSTLQEKIDEIKRLGVDHLVIVDFTTSFSKLTAEQFIKNILKNKLLSQRLLLGYNHHFGSDGRNTEECKHIAEQYGISASIYSKRSIESIEKLSSSVIRKYILNGEMQKALVSLGRPYCFSGKVVDGKKIGRTIGYPTANISEIAVDKILPCDGVYAVMLECNYMNYGGVLNIGVNPTFGENEEKTLEVNIFDFDGDIYGKQVVVNVFQMLRKEQKFNTLTDLKNQIANDVLKAKELLFDITNGTLYKK